MSVQVAVLSFYKSAKPNLSGNPQMAMMGKWTVSKDAPHHTPQGRLIEGVALLGP